MSAHSMSIHIDSQSHTWIQIQQTDTQTYENKDKDTAGGQTQNHHYLHKFHESDTASNREMFTRTRSNF